MTDNAGRRKKICFVASSGGHWEELQCLKEIMNENDSFFVTEKGGQSSEMDKKKLYEVTQINRREKFFFFHFVKLFFRAAHILRRERPDVVISTGALIAYPFCLLAKLGGKKIVFIETFARVYDKSLTGKLIYPIADLFVVQWETLLKVYPKAVYTGGIF